MRFHQKRLSWASLSLKVFNWTSAAVILQTQHALSCAAAGSLDRRQRARFQIPHSLAFLSDRREVCVADRENGRIQCFIADTGEFVKEIKKEEFGGKVFAISYSPAGGESAAQIHETLSEFNRGSALLKTAVEGRQGLQGLL